MTERVFILARFRFAEDAGGFLSWGFLALGKLFVERRDAFHARGLGVGGGPLAEEDGAFLLHFGVGDGVCGCDAETFKEGLVGEGALETGSGVLDEAVEDGEGAELFVDVAVFALARSGPASCWMLGVGGQTYSFFRIALAASVGPSACSLMTSIRSTMPVMSSPSYCSLVKRSIWTVTAVYGFFWRAEKLSMFWTSKENSRI